MTPNPDQPRGQRGNASEFGNKPRRQVSQGQRKRRTEAGAAGAAAAPTRLVRAKWLADELAQQRIIKVAPSMKDAAAMVNDAAVTARAAKQVAGTAPSFALTGYWDAARKAITSHMTANGLAIDNKPGAHVRAVEYAEATFTELSDEEIDAIDALRDDRHDAEYGIHPRLLDTVRLKKADETTKRVITLVKQRLIDEAPKKRA